SASPDLHRTARPGRASAQRGRVAPPDIAGPTPPPDNVMGGTLVTRRGDIATVCHQRPAHDSSQPQPAERGGPTWTGPSQPIRATLPGRDPAERGRVPPPDIGSPTPPPDNLMGGTLVTRRGDIANVCHQRPTHDSSQPQPAERGGPSGTGPSQPIRPKARPDRRRPCAPPRTAPGHPPSSRCPRSP